MNNRKHRYVIDAVLILICTLVIFSVKTVSAQQTDQSIQFYYDVIDGGAVITGVDSVPKEMVIPDSIDGYPVKAIGESAFIYNPDIKSVVIPNSIKSLNKQAFFGCASLEKVEIGEGLTEIGENCFNGCSALYDIKLPSSLTKIGAYAFLNCKALRKIELPNNVDLSGACIFSFTGLTEVTIPGSVDVIGRDAFSYCYSLEKVTIGNGVKRIEMRAFANCYSLKSVSVPDSVTTLGEKAFCYDNALETIKLGKNIREIGMRTITESFAIKNISFNEGLKTITSAGCEDNPRLRSVYIPASVKNLEGIGLTHYPIVEQFRIIVNGKAGSYAQEWAKRMGYQFIPIVSGKNTTSKVINTKKVKAGYVSINAKNFPDEQFRSYISKFDKNKDGLLSKAEIAAVTKIEVPAMKIKSMEGIEFFTALTYLDCGLNELSKLDISKNTKLVFLWCSGNALSKLDVTKNKKLQILWCGNNELTSLDVSKNTSLYSLSCQCNQLSSLDVSELKVLKELSCSVNKLTKLDVSKNKQLYILYCYYNKLTSLDITNNTALGKLYCGYNALTTVDTSQNPELLKLNIAHCHDELESLDLSKNTKLVMLHVSDNYAIKEIDAGNLSNLQEIYCSSMEPDRIILNKVISKQILAGSDLNIIYKDTSENALSKVKNGNGIEAYFVVNLDDGREIQSSYCSITLKEHTKVRIYLDSIPFTNLIRGYNFSFRRYGLGEVKIKIKIENARLELPSGEKYVLAYLNGNHVFTTVQNTWDDSADYVIGGLEKTLSQPIPSLQWHAAFFKADITVESIK